MYSEVPGFADDASSKRPPRADICYRKRSKTNGNKMDRHNSGSKRKSKERHYRRNSSEKHDLSTSEESSCDGNSSKHKKAHKRHHHHRSDHGSDHKKHHHSRKPKENKAVVEQISAEDYFRKSAEYRKWLSEKDITFGNLTSDDSRKYFLKFVKKWNNGRLSKDYYAGLETADVPHTSQTKYKWKLHDVNEDELYRVAHSVGQDTHQGHHDFKHHSTERDNEVIGPMLPTKDVDSEKDYLLDEEEEQRQEEIRVKLERKRFKQDQKLVLDELLPKATGRDAKIEKRRALAEQRAAREISPETKESDLMGCQSSSIKKRIVAIREKRDRRSKVAKEKLMDYHAKEAAKAQAILELARANRKQGALWK